MLHLNNITKQSDSSSGNSNITLLEQIILLGFTALFYQFPNYQVVLNNLEKFYRKTPADL